MRAISTIAVIPGSSHLSTRNAPPAGPQAAGMLSRLFPRRRKPTLFHRCLAVHIASAGTQSALR